MGEVLAVPSCKAQGTGAEIVTDVARIGCTHSSIVAQVLHFTDVLCAVLSIPVTQAAVLVERERERERERQTDYLERLLAAWLHTNTHF